VPLTVPQSGDLTVLYEDDGRHVHACPQATITGDLRQPFADYRWTEISSTDEEVLARVSAQLDGEGGSTASFHAAAPGEAQLVATDNPPQGSRRPSMLWRVSVSVSERVMST
jgi:hypothetical protein